MGKLSTPAWITEGYDSKADWEKAQGIDKKKKAGKIFKVRKCPKCNSDEVGVKLVGQEGKSANNWECKKCGWVGRDVKIEELSEDEFMKYLDEKGEDVA
jgi:transcription elongation factor Elf1